MDEDRIGLVLARTADLKSKITNCIQETTSNMSKEGQVNEGKESDGNPDAEYQPGDDEEEVETLLNIRDALESLEGKLSSLQALQQQQWYEKEAALVEIEHSQKKLLQELKEYKGKDLEIIHEAIAFASETEDHNDFILPPYPSRPSHSLISENGYVSMHKFSQNGAKMSELKDLHDMSRNHHEPVRSPKQFGSRGPFKWVKSLMGAAAKTAVTIAGVITVLTLAGFEPRLRKRDNRFKLSDLLHMQRDDKSETTIECPPGKVPVMENGEMRCVVKERVEIPFGSVIATPNVSYGCG